MKKFISGGIAVCFALALGAAAEAKIIGVAGPVSSAGAPPMHLLVAPSHVIDSMVTNEGIQGFDEEQGVSASSAWMHDTGSLTMGETYDSHMLFLNSPGPMTIIHHEVTFTFDREIKGVMSDIFGMFEHASNGDFAKAGTIYPGGPFQYRGIETVFGDSYHVAGNTITLNLSVTQPGDWIRVVTGGPIVPEPTSVMALFGLGLMGLVGYRRRRS